MNTLKQLQEDMNEEFDEKFYEDGLFTPGKYDGDVVLNWCNQQITLAYNAGKADMLDTVLKEIGGLEFDSGFETSFNKQYRQGKEEARSEILDTLKNKLLDNKE